MKRRKRNRRKNVQGFLFPTPLALLLLVAALLSLGYLWLDARTEALGRAIRAHEARLRTLDQQLINEENRWAIMKSPGEVDTILRAHGLHFSFPGRDRVIRLELSNEDRDEHELAYARIARHE